MNAEMQLFNPLDLELSRSTFEGHPTHSGTMNAGRLIPLMCHDVMPGDEFTYQGDMLIKMSTPVYPTMDQLFCDVFAFYVPYKLILSRRYGTPDLLDSIYSWAAFIGAQDNLLNMPIPANGLELPKLTIGHAIGPGSLMDYFDVDSGYSSYTSVYSVNCLEVLSYFAIWNENFRDPNTMDPVTWSFSNGALVPYGVVPLYATEDETLYSSYNRGGSSWSDDKFYGWVNALGDYNDIEVSGTPDAAVADASYWLPFPVCRFHGYFGSLLPWPQRNTEGVELPLGDSAPVYAGVNENPNPKNNPDPNFDANALAFRNPYNWSVPDNLPKEILIALGGDGSAYTRPRITSEEAASVGGYLSPSNLYADLSSATAANVNALRAAIQKQRWYEKLARSGNRYDELMYGTFGVRPHDSGDDRPRYLGGTRINLRMDMVASTNGGTSASSGQGSGSLGSLGAFSHTNDSSLRIHAGFDDWGTVMFLACIRHHDMFSSGTAKRLTRRIRDDFYFPTFAHLGEQNEPDYLLCSAPTGATLGYNEAWQENRMWLDRVHGLLKPGKSLSFMTYARGFNAMPDLASFFNASTQVEDVDKTLAVSSDSAGFQFVYQFTNNIRARRPLPTHSIPGLMDHF